MGLRYDFRSILIPNEDFFGSGFTYDGDTNICALGNSSIFDGNLKNNREKTQALRNVSPREKREEATQVAIGLGATFSFNWMSADEWYKSDQAVTCP